MKAYEGGPDLVWWMKAFPRKAKKEDGEESYLGGRSSMCKGPEAEESTMCSRK